MDKTARGYEYPEVDPRSPHTLSTSSSFPQMGWSSPPLSYVPSNQDYEKHYGYEGSTVAGHSSYASDAEGTNVYAPGRQGQNGKRRCCGMRRGLFVAILIAIILLVIAGIVIGVLFGVVFPNQK